MPAAATGESPCTGVHGTEVDEEAIVKVAVPIAAESDDTRATTAP